VKPSGGGIAEKESEKLGLEDSHSEPGAPLSEGLGSKAQVA